jgi:segregation and condensation protein B
MVEVAGGYQTPSTRPELHEWVRRLFHERTTQKLSVASLETLAVIAYKQPVTAPEIAEIRGVNTSGVPGTLVERHLGPKVVGRKQVVGRPFLYGTHARVSGTVRTERSVRSAKRLKTCPSSSVSICRPRSARWSHSPRSRSTARTKGEAVH